MVDARALRMVLGRFVTGVTVVTTVDGQGAPRGFTANSFTSVSLDPPLVLVCLATGASSYGAFSSCDGFAVNILADSQQELSRLFASSGGEKFSGTPSRPGITGSPVLEGAHAWIECATHQRVQAGDHVILIGRVVDFSAGEGMPLTYYGGKYLDICAPGGIS